MVFSSFSFLFVFLPVFLGIYFFFFIPGLRGRSGALRSANLVLFLFSLLFYAWGEGLIVLIMLLSTIIDYCAGLTIAGAFSRRRGKTLAALEPGGTRSLVQKTALVVSLVANLSLLGFFKYFNFFLDNVNAGLASLGQSGLQLQGIAEIALPIGISFYTFQTMSYTIDVYRGVVPATRDFIAFGAFVTMFPQLVAGPIVRYRDVEPALRQRQLSLDDFASGVQRFIVGLGKKVLIADYLAVTADRVFAVPGDQLTTGIAWIGAICFTLQLYFDFSGYSDMAIGLGRMIGFRFLENFTYPFISRSLTEYWSRWHISLATWFRDYLYFPLGGSRVAPWRIHINLIAVFLLCGLWHGASWTFVVWGLTHGALLLAERQGLRSLLTRLWLPLQHFYLLLFTLLTKVLFRSESLQQAGEMYAALFGFARGTGQFIDAGMLLNPELVLVIGIAVFGSLPVIPWVRERLERGPVTGAIAWTRAATTLAALALVLFLCITMISYVDDTPFLYFRF